MHNVSDEGIRKLMLLANLPTCTLSLEFSIINGFVQ